LKIGSAIFSCILVVIGIVLISMVIWIVLNNYMMQNSEYILTNNLKRGNTALINHMMRMLHIAIAVEFVINGIRLPHFLCFI